MAQYLTLGSLKYWTLAAICAGIATTSLADTPRDPTLPPANIGLAGTNVRTTSSLIQSITLMDGKRYAMIAGATVKTGDTITEGRIVNITENAVLVKTATGLITLKLFPNVDKHVHQHAKPTHQPSVHRN